MIDLDEIAETLAATPAALRTLLAHYDDDVVSAPPEPGEWCVKEVVGHLVTCDGGAFRDRIEAIATGASEVPPFDAGAALDDYDPMSSTMAELLDDLDLVRRESAAFVRSLDVSAIGRTAPYRDHGEFAAADFVLEWPFHDQDHIRQIMDAVQRHYLPHMTPSMRTALTG